MEEQTITSGQTEQPRMMGYIDGEGILHATIEQILDSVYDEDLRTYNFIVRAYSGDIISVAFKPQHIKEMTLFVRKEQAEQQYFNHLAQSN